MAYIDEKIALLEREVRRQKEEEARQLEEAGKGTGANEEDQAGLTLEEVLDGVRQGTVVFPNQEKFDFILRTALAGQVSIPFIKDIYTGVEENDEASIFVDHDRGISQMITLTDRPIMGMSIGKWKKQLEEGMRKVNAYAEVTGEHVLENLDYLCYRTPTGKGWVYNVAFRIRAGKGRVAGNYNCYEKDRKTYGIMLEALVIRLNDLLSDHA